MSPLPRPTTSPAPLTLRRWLDLYLPLAFTFLLMSGSSPVINKGIGHLPDDLETTGLATFANTFVICLFLYSPVFAVRDVALKLVRGRTSYRRVLVFHLSVASACTLPLLLLSLTPLLDGVVVRGIMQLPEGLVAPLKRAVLAFLPMPVLITLRGVHQAVHITNDTPRWIGIGTAGRFVMIVLVVFGVGVPLRLEGGIIGGMAIALGIGTEMVVNTVTSRRRAAFLSEDPRGEPPPTYRELWSLGGPLFLANAMGVFLQPLAIAIVNGALLAETSAAAFGVAKSFTWFFSSTLFAMQAMALARADSVANLKRLAAFTTIPVLTFTALILVVGVVPPVRTAVLRGFFEISGARTVEFVAATLPIALALPALMAFRSAARGLLIRSGRTKWVTLASLAGLLLLLGLNQLSPSARAENGAAVGYLCWIAAMTAEMVVLVFGVARVGVTACVTESGRLPALREEEVEGEVASGAGMPVPDRR